MVCSLGNVRMAALARLQAVERVSQTVIEEVGHQKLSAQYMRSVLREADEGNFLDEEDMHIFGLRPMTDPLNLVCCNACKKPIKASRYTAHAELCTSLKSGAEIFQEPHGPAVNKKPPRKERKKLQTAHANQTTSLRGPKNFKSIDSDDKNASESYLIGQIQITPGVEAKRNAHLNVTSKSNGSKVSPYSMECSEDVTIRPSKPVKRTAAEDPSTSGIKSLSRTPAKVLPYVPAPLATKIYYSQRNNHLRRAIRHMFFEESSKDSCSDASHMEVVQVNAVPAQTSSPSIFNHEQVNQQRDTRFLPPGETPDQILTASSELYAGKSGGTVSSMNIASQLPVNNTLGPHYMSNSRSFAGKAGNAVRTVKQGSGSVPVV
ncbi:hypothetical protein ACJIZ3_014060 [Penstemon smallii]|uniref:SAGA-associated factor 11 n=1 Tax=Penstemon smallii TaxID=265156 RepID=A0ABD3RIF7_9LAMI